MEKQKNKGGRPHKLSIARHKQFYELANAPGAKMIELAVRFRISLDTAYIYRKLDPSDREREELGA